MSPRTEALVPAGSTVRKLLLQFLGSGRSLDDAGISTLKRIWNATEGGPMPDEVVSEFRKIADALGAEHAARRIRTARMFRNEDIPDYWNAEPRKALDMMWDTSDETIEALQQGVSGSRINANKKKEDLLRASSRAGTLPRYASTVSDENIGSPAHFMQNERQYAATRSAEAIRLMILRRLFGDLP